MDSDKTSHHWLIRGMYTILGEVLIASRNICKQDTLTIKLIHVQGEVLILSMNISKHDTLIIKFTLIKVFIPSMNIHLLYNKHSIMRSSHCLMEYLKQDTYKDNTRTIFHHLTKFLLTEHSNTTRSSH